MTIASEITRIKTNIENAYTKAEEKGATMPELLNSDSLAGCIESIPKGSGGGGGIGIPEGYSRVRFIDFDGTILSTQILKDLEEITDIPTPPEHENLEFYRWSWDYDAFDGKKINPYVIGHMDIFPIYNTVDEKIYVYIDINEETGLNVEYQLCLVNNRNSTANTITYNIDFGDGTYNEYEYEKPENNSSSITYIDLPTITHTYSNYGKYVIKIDSNAGYDTELITNLKNKCIVLGSNNVSMTYASQLPNRYRHPEITCIYTNFIQSKNFRCLATYLCENLEIISLTAYYGSRDIDGTYMSSGNGYCGGSYYDRNILNYSKVKHINYPYCTEDICMPSHSRLDSIVLDGSEGRIKIYANAFYYNNIKEVVLPYTSSSHSIDNINGGLILYNLDKPHCFKDDTGNIIHTKNPQFITMSNNSKLGLQVDFIPYIATNCSGTIDTTTGIINISMNNTGSSPGAIKSNTAEELNIDDEPNLSESYRKKGYLPCIVMPRLKKINYNFTFDDDIERVSTYFNDCHELEKIDLSKPYPNARNFRTTGQGMFENCSKLKEIILPETLESIIVYGSIFSGCYNLEKFDYMDKLKIEGSVTSWFKYTGFKYLDLSNIAYDGTSVINVSAICQYANKLKYIKMFSYPYKLSGQNNFYDCNMLEEIDLTNLTEITSTYQFYNCHSLKKVWIPSTCTKINATSSSSSLFYGMRGYSSNDEDLRNLDFTVYTDFTEKPDGWGSYWDNLNSNIKAKVYWGATKENYENGDPVPEATT